MLFFPTADEDFQYFRSQGYYGSLNDMHYKALGDLGYTGSLTDRIHAYLIFTYGSYYEAMRGLRNGTLTFALGPSYPVNGFDPAFVLDFKNSYYRKGGSDSTLSGTITHARASSATMINSDGDLVTVGNDVAREGNHIYNGTAWVNEGVLHESEARTNLATYSNTFSNSAWSRASMSAPPQNVTGPDGTTSGWTITANASGARIEETFTVATSSPYVYSIYAKAGTTDFLYLYPVLFTTPDNSAGVWFDLTNGTVGTQQDASVIGQIADAGNGWFRCSIYLTTTDSSDTSGVIRNIISKGDAQNSCDTGDTLLIYGAQFELGKTPSSYIPTSGSTVTRAAETLTVPAANMPYSSSNMSIQMDGKITYAKENSSLNPFLIKWGAGSTYIRQAFRTDSTFTGRVWFQQRNTATDFVQESAPGSYSPGINVPFNLASRHGATFINGAIDGTALTANTTPAALPDLSSTNLELGTAFMGTISKLRMWDEDLTDSGIEEASS